MRDVRCVVKISRFALLLPMQLFRQLNILKIHEHLKISSASRPPADDLLKILLLKFDYFIYWNTPNKYLFSLVCISLPPRPSTGDLYQTDFFTFYCRWLQSSSTMLSLALSHKFLDILVPGKESCHTMKLFKIVRLAAKFILILILIPKLLPYNIYQQLEIEG